MPKIKTVPEIVQSHANKLDTIALETNSSSAEISYTDIGEIQTGAKVNNNSSTYAKSVQEDIQSYAKNISALSNKIVSDDKASAQTFGH